VQGTTYYGDISPRVAAFAAVDFLDHAENHIVLGKFGDSKPMPANKSQVIKFRRPRPYPVNVVPLQEGVTPPPVKFGYDDVSCTLKQWGDWAELTDVIQDTHQDPVLKHMIMMAGQQAGAVIEQVTYGVVKAGTTVYYANGTVRTSVNTPISLNKLRAVDRGLASQKAKFITSVISASTDYGTSPVEPGWVLVCHTDCVSDVRNLPGFTEASRYGQRSLIHPREFGAIENFRCVSSADLAPFAAGGGTYNGSGVAMVSTDGISADVYPCLIFGQQSFGLVPLKNDPASGDSAVVPMVVNPGKPSPTDPLGQRGSVGWKTWFNAVILNDAWMARLEVSVTSL
jgi:N4-gp56 family major capsid protein